MTTLWLVRHASTSWTGRRYCGVSDPDLDADGRRAAARLAADLATELPAGVRIVTSPLVRAATTATAIALAAGAAPPESDDRWREADMGIAEGLTFDALEALDPDLARRLAAGETAIDWPRGETSTALETRVGDALTSLQALGRPTVVVSHAGPLRLAIAQLAGGQVPEIPLPATGSVTRIELTTT